MDVWHKLQNQNFDTYKKFRTNLIVKNSYKCNWQILLQQSDKKKLTCQVFYFFYLLSLLLYRSSTV